MGFIKRFLRILGVIFIFAGGNAGENGLLGGIVIAIILFVLSSFCKTQKEKDEAILKKLQIEKMKKDLNS